MRYLPYLFVVFLFLSACSDDDEPGMKSGEGSEGFFVVNEGSFGAGNASISFYDRSDDAVSNNVFNTTNGIPLGDQAQSMTVHEGKGYIVVQNSGKLEVVDGDSWEQIATITDGIESPRYFVGANETKGYVSDWGDGFSGSVKVIDLTSNSVTKTIPVGSGPNQMLITGSNLFVTNGGGFGIDSTVAVIDMITDELVENHVLSYNPNSIVMDNDGDLWVATSGFTAYDADFNIDVESSLPGKLIQLDQQGEIKRSIDFEGIGGPSNVLITGSGSNLAYLYGGQIYTLSTSASEAPQMPINDDFYYGISWDFVDQQLVGCKAPDFSSPGSIEFISTDGNVLSSYTVGIAPNSIAFR
jgi:YVTN family beta-propeller protein